MGVHQFENIRGLIKAATSLQFLMPAECPNEVAVLVRLAVESFDHGLTILTENRTESALNEVKSCLENITRFFLQTELTDSTQIPAL